MMWKSKDGLTRVQYDSQILKGREDKRGHYDVQIKRWMQMGAL